MDIVMPDMDGVELLSKLAELKADCPIIVMSGYDGKYLDSVSLIAEAKGLTVLGTLRKPFAVRDLEKLVARVKPAGPENGGESA